ncbi:hypothetical protein M918_02845 [Clostridium sp. BL8]|nr:hypothetical protein M918_02845 [Clostridium sp. BL8]
MDIYVIIVSEKYKHFFNKNIENIKESYKNIYGMEEEECISLRS